MGRCRVWPRLAECCRVWPSGGAREQRGQVGELPRSRLGESSTWRVVDLVVSAGRGPAPRHVANVKISRSFLPPSTLLRRLPPSPPPSFAASLPVSPCAAPLAGFLAGFFQWVGWGLFHVVTSGSLPVHFRFTSGSIWLL